VYVTGRSSEERPGVLPGTVGATADEVTRLGGQGVAVPCDHRVDGEVEALFARVAREQGRLDMGMLAQPMFDNVGDWKPPLFTGRVVAAFVAGGDWLARSGEALVVEDLAKELGVSEQ
jgi:hypothetical protein